MTFLRCVSLLLAAEGGAILSLALTTDAGPHGPAAAAFAFALALVYGLADGAYRPHPRP